MTVPYDPMLLVEAWKHLAACADDLADQPTYRYDLVDVGRQALANLSMPLHRRAVEAFQRRDEADLKAVRERFEQLILDMDTLLATHEHFLMGPWLADAKTWATNKAEEALFEFNARNLVTLWGRTNSPHRDYSQRQWAGLLRDFYLPRWGRFFDRLTACLENDEPFDAEGFKVDIRRWEKSWTQKRNDLPTEPRGDAIEVTRELIRKYQPMLNEIYSQKGAAR
jgi:alpha-N-acetylglucosaminidase